MGASFAGKSGRSRALHRACLRARKMRSRCTRRRERQKGQIAGCEEEGAKVDLGEERGLSARWTRVIIIGVEVHPPEASPDGPAGG